MNLTQKGRLQTMLSDFQFMEFFKDSNAQNGTNKAGRSQDLVFNQSGQPFINRL
jgi:hypothetical protein